MTSKFANIDTTKSMYIQNPPNSQKPDVNGGVESNRPSTYYPNNNEDRPVGFSNPLYGNKIEGTQNSERQTQQGNTNRPSILPSKEVNLNSDSAPFRLNPGFTIAGEGNQNRGTLMSQQFDSMIPMSKTTEANLKRIADQVNQESQIKTTKTLDNYQFGTIRKQDVDLDVKENSSSEFYSNLAIKAKNMMDLLQSLSDSTVFSDDTYKNFKTKRTNNKQEINRFEGEILSKQDIEDLSTLYNELKVIDALALSVDKYAELAAEAVKFSQFFREQGIEVSPKEYLDLDTEFVNIHDAVSKEQQILKVNLERFLEIWKSKPNTPDCEEKAHVLFKGLQDHKKVYQAGWDKCAKLMTLIANVFEDFAKDVYRNTNSYKTKIGKLKNCKHEIETADSYNKKLVSITGMFEKEINILKKLFNCGKTNYPSLEKSPDYIDQLTRIQENINLVKKDLAKIRYHIKNFGDPCSVETQYFQVFRYRLRDQLEFSLLECERKIDLIKGLGEALFILEKSEQKFKSMYAGDDGAQRKIETAVKELSAKIEGKKFSNDVEKMTEIKKICKQFNTIIAEYTMENKKVKAFLDNSEINDALGPLLIAFSGKLNEAIRNCSNECEKVSKMRFIASEIDNEAKRIMEKVTSVVQYNKFINNLIANNSYQSFDEITSQQTTLQRIMSETRKESFSLESILPKSTNLETRKQIQTMVLGFKTNDDNLVILDEISTATGKIKATIDIFLEKTKSNEIVKHIELNATFIKDEKNLLDQTATKLSKFQDEKSGKDYESVLTIGKWYHGQFVSISQIYLLTLELFTKKLSKIRSFSESTTELESTYKEFSNAVFKEIGNISDKVIRAKFEDIIPRWGEILKVKVKEESNQSHYRSDLLLYLQEKLNRLEFYNFADFETIRNDLQEIRKKHNSSTPSTIENVLSELINLKHKSLQDSVLNLCYDYATENELGIYLNKTLPGIVKSVQEKIENNDFDSAFGENQIKMDFISWGEDITKAVASLQKLLESLSMRLNDFHVNKLNGRYQTFKDFLAEFMNLFEDIGRKFSTNNQNFKNFSKFSPVLDISGYYTKYFDFETGKYKLINELSQAYTKYVDSVKKYGSDAKNYLNRNSDLIKAKTNYDNLYDRVELNFGSMMNLSEKIEEMYVKDRNIMKIINDIVEMVQGDDEDINLKTLNDNLRKLESSSKEVYHGDLEEAFVKVLPEIIKTCEARVNAPKPDDKITKSMSNVQNGNQISKSNTQPGQPSGGNNNILPKKPTLNTDEDDVN